MHRLRSVSSASKTCRAMKNSSTISWLIVSGLTFCLPAVVQAQNVKVIADREAARRQAHIPRGEEVLARAQAELHAKQYAQADRKSTRLNSSHQIISYAVFCLK